MSQNIILKNGYSFIEVDKFEDGTKMRDDKIDDVIFIKEANKYYKRDFKGAIKSTWFGCIGDGIKNDSESLQKAINTCLILGKDLEIDGKILIKNKININRQVDSEKYRKYFTIFSNSGGGFKIACDYAFTSDLKSLIPVSQLIKFQNLYFEGVNNYILDGNKFLRLQFNSCSFSAIKLLTAQKYIQSIYLFNCNIRNWSGTFILSSERTYDLKINGCIVEAGGTFLDIAEPYGSSIIGSTIEGLFEYAIIYHGARGFSVIGNYFEGNKFGDLVNRNIKNSEGIAVVGNFFYNTNINDKNVDYSIEWNKVKGAVSLGNASLSKLHNSKEIRSNVDVFDNSDNKIAFNVISLNNKIEFESQDNFYRTNRNIIDFRIEFKIKKNEFLDGVKITGIPFLNSNDEILGYSLNFNKLIFIKNNNNNIELVDKDLNPISYKELSMKNVVLLGQLYTK